MISGLVNSIFYSLHSILSLLFVLKKTLWWVPFACIKARKLGDPGEGLSQKPSGSFLESGSVISSLLYLWKRGLILRASPGKESWDWSCLFRPTVKQVITTRSWLPTLPLSLLALGILRSGPPTAGCIFLNMQCPWNDLPLFSPPRSIHPGPLCWVLLQAGHGLKGNSSLKTHKVCLLCAPASCLSSKFPRRHKSVPCISNGQHIVCAFSSETHAGCHFYLALFFTCACSLPYICHSLNPRPCFS